MSKEPNHGEDADIAEVRFEELTLLLLLVERTLLVLFSRSCPGRKVSLTFYATRQLYTPLNATVSRVDNRDSPGRKG